MGNLARARVQLLWGGVGRPQSTHDGPSQGIVRSLLGFPTALVRRRLGPLGDSPGAPSAMPDGARRQAGGRTAHRWQDAAAVLRATS